ncbi:hypothetical protein PM082_016067 [Marasmius tenuissimus]|nr:hypothetical protein PM082_016067 [Marasmius tenuissimus]
MFQWANLGDTHELTMDARPCPLLSSETQATGAAACLALARTQLLICTGVLCPGIMYECLQVRICIRSPPTWKGGCQLSSSPSTLKIVDLNEV